MSNLAAKANCVLISVRESWNAEITDNPDDPAMRPYQLQFVFESGNDFA